MNLVDVITGQWTSIQLWSGGKFILVVREGDRNQELRWKLGKHTQGARLGVLCMCCVCAVYMCAVCVCCVCLLCVCMLCMQCVSCVCGLRVLCASYMNVLLSKIHCLKVACFTPDNLMISEVYQIYYSSYEINFVGWVR